MEGKYSHIQLYGYLPSIERTILADEQTQTSTCKRVRVSNLSDNFFDYVGSFPQPARPSAQAVPQVPMSAPAQKGAAPQTSPDYHFFFAEEGRSSFIDMEKLEDYMNNVSHAGFTRAHPPLKSKYVVSEKNCYWDYDARIMKSYEYALIQRVLPSEEYDAALIEELICREVLDKNKRSKRRRATHY